MPRSASHQPVAPIACGLAAEVVRRFGILRLRVTGCSMLPMVLPGDILVVHRQSAQDIVPGDIAVFMRHQRLFAHRVVGRTCAGGNGLLLTRGDTHSQIDPPVSGEELLGRVAAIERGRRRMLPRKPAGWNLFLAKMGRRSNTVLLAMAGWHGLRLLAERSFTRMIQSFSSEQESAGSLKDFSV